MGGEDELAVGEGGGEAAHDNALPAGVEVEFDLVDEDEGLGLERVGEQWGSEAQPPC